MRHATILDRQHAALLVIDIQDRIHVVMRYREEVENNTHKLIRGFQLLHLPILLTEQYPKGLGHTISSLRYTLQATLPIQKMTFSCRGCDELMRTLEEKRIHQVVLAGIETHVCVLQTALDLMANHYQVHVVRDAVSSRHDLDHQTALQRLAQAGAIITTTEAVLFELLGRADTPEFKEVSKLLK
ncbi:MAG: hydrolase [candidate division KSB1 bacterium]|nr:hydrolase [candidate division KSB1 bacterium]MDZ7301474.1 hydrolase [candidate division KSB1 bacterium]MDZ7310876.1 hydrolase [candidate division KSB1 bacterium]